MGKNSNTKNTVYYHPSVTVIVCTYNSENTVEKTINSLLNLNYPSDKLEIILMDDGSSDNTFNICMKYRNKNVRVLKHDKNKGLAAAQNTAVKHAHGNIIALTSDDCVVDPDWLLNLTKCYNNNDIGGVGGIYVVPNDANQFTKLVGMCLNLPNPCIRDEKIIKKSIISRIIGQVHYLMSVPTLEEGVVLSIAGGNASYRKQVIFELGGWDERFRYGKDDADLNKRLIEHGYKLKVNRNATVYHYHKSDPRKFLEWGYKQGRFDYLYFKKYASELSERKKRLYLKSAICMSLFPLGLLLSKLITKLLVRRKGRLKPISTKKVFCVSIRALYLISTGTGFFIGLLRDRD